MLSRLDDTDSEVNGSDEESLRDLNGHPLPIEMLSTILAHGLLLCNEHEESRQESRQTYIWDREEYAMTVSQISQIWRKVALDTPSLWSTLAVSPRRLQQEQPLRMLELFIHRSRSHPLSIVIILEQIKEEEDGENDGSDEEGSEEEGSDGNDAMEVGQDPFPQYIATMIFPLVARWRELTIVGVEWENVCKILLPLRETCAPLLEKLTIDMSDRTSMFNPKLRLFQAGASKLAHVELQNVLLAHVHIPRLPLVSLRLNSPLGYLSIDPQWHSLARSNHLTELHIEIAPSFSDFAENDYSVNINIPTLRSMTLDANFVTRHTTASIIMSGLKAPLLECLTIQFCHLYISVSERKDLLATVVQAIGRHKHPLLSSLNLRFADFEVLPAITSFIPSITHVTLVECFFLSNLLRNILPAADPNDADEKYGFGLERVEGVHWPHLRAISISEPTFDRHGLNNLCDIISDRIARTTSSSIVQPIASLTLTPHTRAQIPDDTFAWLKERVAIKVCQVD